MKAASSRHFLAGAVTMLLIAALSQAAAAPGAPRGHYTVVSPGVVRDTKAGLDWRQRPAPDFYALHDAVDYCYRLPGGGWRLPTIKELQTLVDDRAATAPTIDTTAFPDTPPLQFWSSTAERHGGQDNWAVHFGSGRTVLDGVQSKNKVRCVR